MIYFWTALLLICTTILIISYIFIKNLGPFLEDSLGICKNKGFLSQIWEILRKWTLVLDKIYKNYEHSCTNQWRCSSKINQYKRLQSQNIVCFVYFVICNTKEVSVRRRFLSYFFSRSGYSSVCCRSCKIMNFFAVIS